MMAKMGRCVKIVITIAKNTKLRIHNEFGEAWWNDGDVKDWRCAFSAIGDA